MLRLLKCALVGSALLFLGSAANAHLIKGGSDSSGDRDGIVLGHSIGLSSDDGDHHGIGGNHDFDDDDHGVGGVPELGTWAMVIIGFGAVGIQLRRRGRVAA